MMRAYGGGGGVGFGIRHFLVFCKVGVWRGRKVEGLFKDCKQGGFFGGFGRNCSEWLQMRGVEMNLVLYKAGLIL